MPKSSGILQPKAPLPEKLVIDIASETVHRFRQVREAENRHLPLLANVVLAIDAHAPTVPLYNELA
jgi:serine/threonine-protein kinase HipA